MYECFQGPLQGRDSYFGGNTVESVKDSSIHFPVKTGPEGKGGKSTGDGGNGGNCTGYGG